MPDRSWLAVLFLMLAPAAGAGPSWVLEIGQADRDMGSLMDDDCPASGSGDQRLFDCRWTSGLSADTVDSWALGLDYPLVDAPNGSWQAGFRLGRYTETTLRSEWQPAAGERARFQSESGTDFALATLARDYTLGRGWSVRLGAGVGMARTTTRDSRYDRFSGGNLVESRLPPDNEGTGYALRGEIGFGYAFSGNWRVDLLWRREAFENLATGRGEGTIDDGQSETEVTFDRSRASLAIESISLTLSLPLGTGAEAIE